MPSSLHCPHLEEEALSEMISVKAANKHEYLFTQRMSSVLLLPRTIVEMRGIKINSTGKNDKSMGSKI